VDEIKAQPGMPVSVLEQAEGELVQKADVVFVTSTTLELSRREINPRTYYLPNVADYDHFSQAMSGDTAIPADLALIPGPRIGFIGAISGYKIDFDLLRQVAEQRPEWSLVMIGEVGEGDPWTDPSVLKSAKNIHLLGPRAYSALPQYLKGFDVAILPNRLNDYTAAMFPMKFFEYLAAGRPVVSTSLASLKAYEKHACLAKSAHEFIDGISDALSGRCASLDDRLGLARQHTYEARMDRMLKIVAETAR
jgi:glycosyltransferase involved in cell wall biosynthesis